jgi:DNA-3-methyladenine glycosylase II
MNTAYFSYGQKELEYLKSKDKQLAEAIDRIGMIERSIVPDLFCSLINAIIGQQISTKAQKTIWSRLQDLIKDVCPEELISLNDDELQSIGLSYRKVKYIKNIAHKVQAKELDLHALQLLSDEEVCAELSKLKGVGKWTAEMIMLFSMHRMNILSYGDLAILKGMRMLYHHREIKPEKFVMYWRRYSPYASVVSLYLWAISSGAIPEMKDYAPKKRKK